jgi:predicted transcriptional regulator
MERARTAHSLIDDHQKVIADLSRIRRDALEDLLQNGYNQTQLADFLGVTRSRISQLLSAGTRPERAFLGTGRLTVAIGSKREVGTKVSVSEMISAECFTAYSLLADLAHVVGLDIEQEVVPPPGVVHLNRSNLIVMTNPRLLPFMSQVMEADPHIRYVCDRKNPADWYLVDLTTGVEYRSPRNSGIPRDYGYVGRLPRPDGKGNFLYLAGTHAPGTLGAATFLADNLATLHRDLKTRRFSTIVEYEFDPTNPLSVVSVERVTPIYRADAS